MISRSSGLSITANAGDRRARRIGTERRNDRPGLKGRDYKHHLAQMI